ncbi:putative transposase [Yasminevirus sp. GU-2018]|uniref:Putative transposase n=1 Tax=Yasminevirus sp. GU-2018 TaxID=2420051 RepID=A0A5K0U8Y8_9VIRU|nr:putative transposase [Yasminevirus sp. GU-2018]
MLKHYLFIPTYSPCMSLLPSQKSTTLSLRIPFDGGPTLAKSTSSLPKATIDATSSLTPSKKTKKMVTEIIPSQQSTFMQESLLVNKNLTFNINSPSYLNSFQITRNFLTSDPVSTLEEKVLKPFWTNSSKMNSQKLWLPVKTDSLVLDSNSSKIFSLALMPKLSSSTVPNTNSSKKNFQKTSSVSSHSLQQSTPDIVSTTHGKLQKQKATLNQKSYPTEKIMKVLKVTTEKTKMSRVLLTKNSQKKQSLDQKREDPKNNKQQTERSSSKELNQKSRKSVKHDIEISDISDIGSDDDSDVKINKSTVCRKIRVYPTEEQKKFFNKCFGTSRYIYNKGVEHINRLVQLNNEKIREYSEVGCIFLGADEDGHETQCCSRIDKSDKYFCSVHKSKQDRWSGYRIDTSLATIRGKVLVNDKDMDESERWQKDVPYDTRQLVLKDLIGGFKSATSNKIRGNVKEFKMRYKSRKDTTHIFHINKKAITPELEIFKTRKIGALRVRSKMKRWLTNNIKSIDSDCKIIKYRGDQYYLLLSIVKSTPVTKIPFDAVSLDPGVRTFQTFYSPNGLTGKIGEDFAQKSIMKTAIKIDKLDSGADTADNWRTRRNIRSRQALLRTKIKNVVNDLHWKTVNFLCNNFKTIITTHFETKKMTAKEGRDINNKSVRMMLGLSHYTFKQKLLERAKQKGNHVMIVDESYTSKTCGRCGEIKEDLKGDKMFKCEKCGLKIDRDTNGARNIMIRLLTE